MTERLGASEGFFGSYRGVIEPIAMYKSVTFFVNDLRLS